MIFLVKRDIVKIEKKKTIGVQFLLWKEKVRTGLDTIV